MKKPFSPALAIAAGCLFSIGILTADEKNAPIPDGRIDIDAKGAPDDLQLSVVEASSGTSVESKNKSLIIWNLPAGESEWTQAKLKIKANKECKARLRLKSQYTKSGEEIKWVLYDSLQAEGAEVRNSDFEAQPNSKQNGWKLEEQNPGLGPRWLKDPAVAKSGEHCILAWHNGPATYAELQLPADKAVELSVWIRKPAKNLVPQQPAAK